MKPQLILPTILIVITFASAFVYLYHRDYKMFVYFFSAGVLNSSVSYW